MIRNLLIIMGVGLVLAVVGLGGAFAVGGPAVVKDGWNWSFTDDNGDWVRVSHDGQGGAADDGPDVTRSLAWTGGTRLTVDAPADVIFTQGDTPSVTVTGPQSQVERLRLEDGRLSLSPGAGLGAWRRSLKVVITAPNVSDFEINGSQDVSLRGLDLPRLSVSVSGSGEVDAAGRARAVDVDVSGSGEVDMTALEVTDADVSISGSGDVQVGPTGAATVAISGSGDVGLTRRPASVQTRVSGSGDVNERW